MLELKWGEITISRVRLLEDLPSLTYLITLAQIKSCFALKEKRFLADLALESLRSFEMIQTRFSASLIHKRWRKDSRSTSV